MRSNLILKSITGFLDSCLSQAVIKLNSGKKEGMVWFNKHAEVFDNDAAIEKLKTSLETCMTSFQQAKVL